MIHILFLDIDPKMCAYAHSDKDVKLKVLTYTKLLANAHHTLDPEGEILKSLDPPVVHFPSTSWWVEENNSNYQWLHDLWLWLHKEYWYRYDTIHDDWTKFYNKLSHVPKNIKEGELTTPPCSTEIESLMSLYTDIFEDTIQNFIESSRQIYTKQCKEDDAKWGGIVENMRTPPSWIIENANV